MSDVSDLSVQVSKCQIFLIFSAVFSTIVSSNFVSQFFRSNSTKLASQICTTFVVSEN